MYKIAKDIKENQSTVTKRLVAKSVNMKVRCTNMFASSTIKDILIKGAGLLVTAGKALVTLIAEAKVESIIKGAMFVGGSIYSAYVLIKYAREKQNLYKTGANMSPVDRALALNYSDKENRKKLQPLMDEINRSFKGGKKRAKKKINKLNERDRKELERLSRRIQAIVPNYVDDDNEIYDRETLRNLEEIKKGYAEFKRMDKAKDLSEDEFVLRRILDCPAY